MPFIQSHIHSLEASSLTSITAMASQAMEKDLSMTVGYSLRNKTTVKNFQTSPISIAIYLMNR